MRGAESARKVASLTVIALVIAASCLLWQTSPSPLLPAGRLPAVSLVQHPFRVEPAPGVRPGSEWGQIGVRPGSEYEYAATQLGVTSGSQEMRTLLEARSLPLDAAAPSIAPNAAYLNVTAPMAPGPVSRAMLVAGRETSDAFRTVGRVVRSLF